MSVLKRYNGTTWETVGPEITSTRFNSIDNMIAPEYSPNKTYNVGDYVVQSDRLYRCISAIEEIEEWTPAHWSQVSIGEEVDDLKSALEGFKFTAPFDVISTSRAKTSEGSITYTRIDNNTWDISGATTSSPSFKNLISNYPVIPGDLYEFRIDGGIDLRVYLTINDTDKMINYTDGTYRLLAPVGATKILIRWQIAANTTIPEGTRATIYVLHYTADSYKSLTLIHNGLSAVHSDAWQFGGNAAGTGNITSSTTEIYVWQTNINGNVVWLDIADGYTAVICYFSNDGIYQGSYRNGYFAKAAGGELVTRFYTDQLPDSGSFRIHIRKTSDETITQDEGQTAVAFYCIPDSAQGADSGTLESTGDETDRTAEVQALLSTNGICKFGKGKYYVKNVQMPDNTKVCGQGANTEIVLIGNDLNYENLWTYGDQNFTRYFAQDVSLPAGDYSVTADITSTDTDATNSVIAFYYRSPYNSSNSKYVYLGRGNSENATFTVTEPIVHIELFAGSTYTNSADDSATYQNISLVKVENASAFILGSNCEVANMAIIGAEDSITLRKANYMRYGVLHEGTGTDSDIGKSNIHDCWFKRFNGACICLNNSGYSAHNGLNISGCYMNASRAGVDIQRLSEFHRVINCSSTGNYYGIINNGGNNEFVGCDLSANRIGFAIDNITGLKTNNSHGGVSGCIMQHNSIRAIYINRAGSGFVFTGCNIDNGGIEIINACRIIFVGCNFMSDSPIVISGVYGPNTSMIMFNACNMRISENNTYTITDGAIAKFINCYTEAGTLVDPTAS